MEQSEMSESDEEFEVERILADRPKYSEDSHKRRKFLYTEYLIRWVGYSDETWEPEENLKNCKKLLSKYKKEKKLERIKNYNKNNNASLKNMSRTPIKSSFNKKIANLNNNNKTKEKREQKENINRESNDKKINEDESTLNYNNQSYNQVYSDEEKFIPTKLNLNQGVFNSEYLKLDSNNEETFTSITKKIDKIKKNKSNIDNSFPSNDFIINNENENYEYNVINNNENNNNNYYNYNNNFEHVLPSFVGFKQKRNKSKALQNNFKLSEDLSIGETPRKKENINLDDDISISIDDPFIKMERESISNSNDNSNSNINYINTNRNYKIKKENLELLEIRIPPKNKNSNDQIDIVWRDKEKNDYFKCTSKNTAIVPQNVLIDCYEKILKTFLDGKNIKIN